MSSKRHLRRRSCEGKQQYPDAAAAKIAAGKASRFYGEWLSSYKCQFCGNFHVGHPSNRKKQSIIAKRGF